jgi:hypothetical protein
VRRSFVARPPFLPIQLVNLKDDLSLDLAEYVVWDLPSGLKAIIGIPDHVAGPEQSWEKPWRDPFCSESTLDERPGAVRSNRCLWRGD